MEPQGIDYRNLPLPIALTLGASELVPEASDRLGLVLRAWESSVFVLAAQGGRPPGPIHEVSTGKLVERAPRDNRRYRDPELLDAQWVLEQRPGEEIERRSAVSRAQLLGSLAAYRNWRAHRDETRFWTVDVNRRASLLTAGLVHAWELGLFLEKGTHMLGCLATKVREPQLFRMTGERLRHHPGPMAGSTVPQNGRVYLESQDRTADLYPWLLFESGHPARVWFYNKLSGKRLTYYDPVDGSVLAGEMLEQRFPSLLQDATAFFGRSSTPAATPQSMGRFFGREHEVERIREHLDAGERLITLEGPGGIGKTRLSRRIQEELGQKHKCLFVDLTPAVTLTGIGHEIFNALGVPLASSREVEAVTEILGAQNELIVILDNFEQVADLAPETIRVWLDQVPTVRFVVTSRVPLSLYDEVLVPIGPLSIPTEDAVETDDPAKLRTYDGVALFLQRAERWGARSFSENAEELRLIARLCRRLEGLPLAIELAAARARGRDGRDMNESLRSLLGFLKSRRTTSQDHHQTMRDAIRWSYEKTLGEEERWAFLQAAQIEGGFFRDAVSHVIESEDGSDEDALDLVDSLLEKNLLRSQPTPFGERLTMFATIREFGRELWKGTDPKKQISFSQRWAGYYIANAEALDRDIHSSEGLEALDRLAFEMENLFSIQDRLLEAEDPQTAARSILAYARAMSVRGPAGMRRTRLGKSLKALGAEESILTVRLLNELSSAHWSEGRWDDGTRDADEAVAIARRIGLSTSGEAARALRQQGLVRKDRGFPLRALESFNGAAEIARAQNDFALHAVIDTDIGSAFDRLGRIDRALSHFDNADRLTRETGDLFQRMMVCNRKALALWHYGEPARAVELLREASRINDELGGRMWDAAFLTNEGLALTDLGDLDGALVCFDQAEEIHKSRNSRAWAGVNFGGWARALVERGQPGDLDRALDLVEKALRVAKEVYYPEDIALHLGTKARALFRLGRPRDARSALRNAISIEQSIHASRDIRHLSNLVLLARIEIDLENLYEARELVNRATDLRDAFEGIDNIDVKYVREDLSNLLELQAACRGEAPTLAQLDENRTLDAGTRGVFSIVYNLTRDHLTPVMEALSKLREMTGYEYPWRGLEADLESRNVEVLQLFGYGSILNRASASRSLSAEVLDQARPAIAFGMLRLFNFEMPDEVRLRYREPARPNERALLNARSTGAITDRANGLVVPVPVGEIESLRKREIGYDIRPFVTLDWHDRRAAPQIVYGFSCPDRILSGRMLTNDEIQPHRGYVEQCEEGAAGISPEFLEYWRHTTFLADGESRLSPSF